MAHKEISPDMRDCIDNCLNCYAICLETINHCLSMGGEHASPEHIGIMQDCARICSTSAEFMLRSSHNHAQVCGVCADICQLCADDCERMANGDELMLRCAEICRRCAESCRQMSGGTSRSATM